MEAAQIEARSSAVHEGLPAVDRSPIPPAAAVSTFLAESGRAHDWLLDALADLASDLIAEPGELSLVVSEQHRLLRQFLDAQRSILRYWAEVDAEVDDILTRRARTTAAPNFDRAHATRSQSSTAETQLRLMLDELWRAEHDAGRMLIATTRSAGTRGAADPEPEPDAGAWHCGAGEADDRVAPVIDAPPVLRDLDRMFDRLFDGMSVDGAAADVLVVIDRLLERLVVPVDRGTEPAPPEPILPAATVSTDAERIGDPDAFARFWGAGRPDDRGWRDRPFVQALMPLASGFLLLTGVLAWIG